MAKLDVLGFIEEKRKACNLEAEKRLLIVQVGDDPASNLYIASKMKEASKWNIQCTLLKFSDEFKDASIVSQVNAMIDNCDDPFHGIIVQSPVDSERHNFDYIVDEIVNTKMDVDGFYYGGRDVGYGYVGSDFQPCAPRGIMMLLKYNTDLEGKKVVVIGRGETVGRPLIKMLLKEKCTLTCCNSYTSKEQLREALCNADIVISAVGEPNLFYADQLRDGCIVIDAGISRVDGKQVGDFSHEGDLDKVYYTSWTNGVGKLTVAALMMNVRGE